MNTPELAIDIQALTKKFGTFTAVDHLTFNVKKGEIFGFLGANGSGKSTTIKMLCGLLGSTSGTATVAGYDINREPDKVKRNIGYMSQRFSLYEDLTVEENIRFFGGIYGLTKEKLQARMDWVVGMAGLTGKEQLLTSELAGGWKQRLALGCAVLHEPAIVFLDEPTGGVDPLTRRRFWDLILLLADSGTTVFVTTHYLDEAEYCNRIVLLHEGKLIAEGSPAELKTEYLKDPVLEVECDSVITALELLQGEPWVISTSVFGTYLHVSVASIDEGKLKIERLLSANHIAVSRIDVIVPSLEDVFIHLIEQRSGEFAAQE
ncbi:MAG: ABC transporter ATP-binding protein [Candidatus Kapaibacterium sp.]|jgi:ABC-2 type transport system ATP-binding protein